MPALSATAKRAVAGPTAKRNAAMSLPGPQWAGSLLALCAVGAAPTIEGDTDLGTQAIFGSSTAAAVWGIPVVALTPSRREPATHSGPRQVNFRTLEQSPISPDYAPRLEILRRL
jgi:hypothetical protein